MLSIMKGDKLVCSFDNLQSQVEIRTRFSSPPCGYEALYIPFGERPPPIVYPPNETLTLVIPYAYF